MIGKISKGDSFGGLAHYLTRVGRGQMLDMRNLSASTPKEAGPEMALAASMSRRTKKPVLHLSVSYDPADAEPSDDEMRADAAEILSGLGLADNQSVIVRHRDAEHHHMHIMVNRVGQDGKAVSDSKSYAKTEASLRRIEARRGLWQTHGRHAPDPETGQRMTGTAKATDPRQHSAPEGVRDALLTARSWSELHGRLDAQGWRMERRQRPGQKAGAVLLGPNGEKIAAGKIDRQATLSRIVGRIKAAEAEERAHERKKARAARERNFQMKQAGGGAIRVLTNANRQIIGRSLRRGGRNGFGIGF